MASNGNDDAALATLISENVRAKYIAKAVIIFGAVFIVILTELFKGNKMRSALVNTIEQAKTNVTLVIAFVVATYICVDLIGDMFVASEVGALDDLDDKNTRQTSLIVNGTIGVLLALLVFLSFCSYFKCAEQLKETPILGSLMSFGRKKRKRKC